MDHRHKCFHLDIVAYSLVFFAMCLKFQLLSLINQIQKQICIAIHELIEIEKYPNHHTLILPEPTIRIPLLSGFKRIAISPALNENILSDKILSLLLPNFSIFAGLI